MTRDELLIRAGFYFGEAARMLGDESYALRWLGRAHELTEEEALPMFHEIQRRLVEAGEIAPDEDPFDELGITFNTDDPSV